MSVICLTVLTRMTIPQKIKPERKEEIIQKRSTIMSPRGFQWKLDLHKGQSMLDGITVYMESYQKRIFRHGFRSFEVRF